MEIRKDQIEQLETWQQHPMTQWFFKEIDEHREWFKDYVNIVNLDSIDTTALSSAKACGYIEALNFCTVFEPIEEEGGYGTQT